MSLLTTTNLRYGPAPRSCGLGDIPFNQLPGWNPFHLHMGPLGWREFGSKNQTFVILPTVLSKKMCSPWRQSTCKILCRGPNNCKSYFHFIHVFQLSHPIIYQHFCTMTLTSQNFEPNPTSSSYGSTTIRGSRHWDSQHPWWSTTDRWQQKWHSTSLHRIFGWYQYILHHFTYV